MPGAYRYSATFDRTYEEDTPPPVEQTRRKSQQSPTRHSLSTNGIHQRSASTDSLDSICGSSGSSSSHSRQVSIDNPEHIPTRLVKKATAKPAHNPLQFVKVASCPLSRREMQNHLAQSSGSAIHSVEAEQLAKKKVEPKIKDEEEEWQSNLDNWKSRRRKQSEGALQRLEEIKRLELEDQQRQLEQKKSRTKTFSEMMEERAQRPKQYNLRISSRRASESVLRLGYDFENGSFEKSDNNDNSSCDRESSDSTLCDSTAEEAAFNERPKIDPLESRNESKLSELPQRCHSIGGNNQVGYNRIDKHLSGINENELEHELAKEKLLSSGGYTNTDSGLDSLSSSHKTGDIADSASDFSQDSGSSLDSDFNHTTGSLTTGVELLEEFSSRAQSFSESVLPNYEQKGGNGLELFLRIWLKQGSENKDFGFVLKGGNENRIPVVDSVIPGGVGDQAGLRKNDQILAINGECTQDIKHEALQFVVQQASYTGHLDLVIWRALSSTGSDAQGNSSEDTSKSISSDVQRKKSAQTVEKQNSLVSNRKSSFEGEPKQKEVIQRTNKDIKSAVDFKEKVTSFERRSSADESSTLVSKSVPTKSRPPVPAKPAHLQLNGDVDSTSLSSKSKDSKLISHNEKVSTVDTSKKEVNNANIATVSKPESEVASKSATKDSDSDSKSDLYIDAQHSTKDDAKKCNLNSAHEVNQLMDSPANRETECEITDTQEVVSQPASEERVVVQNHKNEDRCQPQRLVNLQPICNESGLNIIYDSHPEQTTQEANAGNIETSSKTEAKSKHSSKTEAKSKLKLVSQKSVDKTDSSKKSMSKKLHSDKISTDSSVCDKSAEEVKKEKESEDKMRAQNQSQQDAVKQNDDLNSSIYNIPIDLTQDEILLADLDLSSRKIEPPKEKPPPPPPDESDVESSEKPPVMRASSTKEIKRELWKRRSDFLGIEFESGPVEVDESKLPCPPQIEEILKSERELEREKRQELEKQTLLRLQRLAEEEEIARKEREIIENIEREERERQQQALEMEAALLKEREREKQVNEMNHSANRKEVEVNGIHQPKSRKKEKSYEKPPLQQSNSVSRMKKEYPSRESERYIRHQQDAGGGKDSEQPVDSKKEIKQPETKVKQPADSKKEIKQPETNVKQPADSKKEIKQPETKVKQPAESKKETKQPEKNVKQPAESKKETNTKAQSSSPNSVIATKPDEKEIHNSSSSKMPTKKMIMRQERERMRREQEALQKQDAHMLQKHHQQMAQVSKQSKPNGVHQNTVPNRISHERSSVQASGNPWDREDIIYASRHPEASPADAKSENIRNEDGSQELCIQTQPLTKQGLHSLGAAPKAKVMTNEQWVKPNEKVAKRRTDTGTESGYNQYHWLVQEAEIRRINEQKERQYQNSVESRPPAGPLPPPTLPPCGSSSVNSSTSRNQYFVNAKHPPTHCALPYAYPYGQDVRRRNSSPGKSNGQSSDKAVTPNKPPRSSSREQLLSVSGRKRCSHCGNELGRGAAMIIESLQLFYHIQCFCCCVCQAQLGNGSCGTDVRVRNNKLHCQHCYSNDEAGLKFSQV